MSMDFTQTPTTPNGTEADIIYIVSSSLVDSSQFKYVVELRDVNDTELFKIKQPPNNVGLGLFELSNMMHDYTDYDKPFLIDTITYSDNNNVKDFSVVAYYESGSSISSSVTEESGSAVSHSITVIPAVEERNSAFNWQSQSYYDVGLTNQPTTLYARPEDYGTISHLNIGTSIIGFARFKVYDSSNTLIATRIFGNTVVFIPSQTESQKLIHIPYGPQNFTNDVSLNVLSGTGWEYYTVEFLSPLTTIEQTFTVYRMSDCIEENGVRLAFINKLGVFDYYTFELTRTNRENYTSDTYRQTFIPYETVNNTLTYDPTRRGEKIYNKKIEVNETATSNWLTQSEADWLIELFESPSVFKQEGSNFIPVIVSNSSIDRKTNPRGQKLYNLTVEYRFAHPKKSRR